MSKSILRVLGLALLLTLAFLAGQRWGCGTSNASSSSAENVSVPDAVATGPSTGTRGPWIQMISENDADGLVRRLYQQLPNPNMVRNIVKIHSLHPRTMEAQMDLYKILFNEPTDSLTFDDRQRIAVAVSNANQCLYCQAHHSQGFLGGKRRLPSPAECAAIITTPTPRENAMTRFAQKLTNTPDDMTLADVESLRTAGFQDKDILEITLITAYVNFANRVIQGLGVPLESYWGVKSKQS